MAVVWVVSVEVFRMSLTAGPGSPVSPFFPRLPRLPGGPEMRLITD